MQVYYYRPGDPCHVIVIQVIDGPFILLDAHGFSRTRILHLLAAAWYSDLAEWRFW